jgi:hypothetical protein
MNIRLLELDGRNVKPTEHCYMISWLNCIIENFPDNYVKVFAYVYYMSYKGPDNPYFNVVFDDREEKIKRDLQPDFDTEDPMILKAIENCTTLYTTPTMQAYEAIKKMLENMNTYLSTTPITDGRDGNIGPMLRVAKDFKAVRESFKGVYDDVQEENKVKARGNIKLPYDMR